MSDDDGFFPLSYALMKRTGTEETIETSDGRKKVVKKEGEFQRLEKKLDQM